MPITVEAACFSHMGLARRTNEDNLYFSARMPVTENLMMESVHQQIITQESLCFAVFDGVGGLGGGAEASWEAARTFAEDCSQIQQIGLLSESWFHDAVSHMNGAVCARAQHTAQTLGTTAVTLGLSESTVYICSLGDSRCYRMRNASLVRMTQDHAEILAPTSRLKKPRRRLTQYLGIPPEEMLLEPFLVRGTTQPGDVYLLCSDGLTDMVTDAQLEDLLLREEDVAKATRSLVDLALRNGGRDNITVILVKVTELE